MTINKIKQILDLHSVPHYEADGRIYADTRTPVHIIGRVMEIRKQL